MTPQQWGYMPAKAQEEKKMKRFGGGGTVPLDCFCGKNIPQLVVDIRISRSPVDYSKAISWWGLCRKMTQINQEMTKLYEVLIQIPLFWENRILDIQNFF